MKIGLYLLLLNSFLMADIFTMESIEVENSLLDISSTIVSAEKTKATNSITLQEKLQTHSSFNVTIDEKGENAISFRGLDDRSTEYVEDGIPIYRTTGGEVDTNFIMSNARLEINDGSGASSMGVSSMGGEVKLSSDKPSQEFEANFATSISTNDEYYHAYAGTLIDNVYFQTNASFYHTKEYSLSDDFKTTPVQTNHERLNSDKNQKNISLKAGVNVNNALHLAAKVSVSKSEYGIAPNVYTSTTAPVFEAYNRIDEKDLTSIYLYTDYKKNDLEYSLRAYYDEYSDIYAIYKDSAYTAHYPLVTYDDKRLGGIFNIKSTQKNFKNTFILKVDEDEHIRRGGTLETAKYVLDSAKSSFLNQWYINDFLQLETGISYTYLRIKEAVEENLEDKQALDAFMKLSFTDDTSSYYASAAKKSRMPTMSEMFSFFPWEVTNESLKEEESFQYSLGYQQELQAQTSLNISLYYYDISDLIIYRNNTFINRDKAKHYGSEIGVSNSYIDKHNLYFSYAYAHATDSENENLEFIPKHKIKLEDTFKINQNFQGYVSYEYIDSRYSSNSATYSDEQLKLSSYNILNIQLKYNISKKAHARVGIKNLLDENYEYAYGYPSVGRSLYISFEMSL